MRFLPELRPESTADLTALPVPLAGFEWPFRNEGKGIRGREWRNGKAIWKKRRRINIPEINF